MQAYVRHLDRDLNVQGPKQFLKQHSIEFGYGPVKQQKKKLCVILLFLVTNCIISLTFKSHATAWPVLVSKYLAVIQIVSVKKSVYFTFSHNLCLWNSHTLAHKSGIGLIRPIYDQFYNIHQQMIMLSHLHAIVNFLE